MATEKQAKAPRKKKMPETVRERAEKGSIKKSKPKKSAKVKATIHRPLSKLRRIGAKEYHPIKTPDNKVGRVLGKRVRFIPKFITESWSELKQVTWPTKREAASKTGAVIAFAIVFAIFVQVLDLVFSKVVKEIILR
ncbi:MAG: preprotein translocase subunit SecE [Candidatus Saccharimonadales bacterium]